MSEHSYTRDVVDGQWDLPLAELSGSVEGALPGKTFIGRATGSAVTLIFDDALVAEEVTTLDALVAAQKAAFSVLPGVKAARHHVIDARTVELIREGFLYAGKIFSLSVNAQSYWNGLGNLTGNNLLTEPDDFPLTINTLDDSETYDIQNIADAMGVFATAAATVKSRLGSGTALKTQIRNATTLAEVDAVVDNR